MYTCRNAAGVSSINEALRELRLDFRRHAFNKTGGRAGVIFDAQPRPLRRAHSQLQLWDWGIRAYTPRSYPSPQVSVGCASRSSVPAHGFAYEITRRFCCHSFERMPVREYQPATHERQVVIRLAGRKWVFNAERIGSGQIGC